MALKEITPQSADRIALLIIGPAGIGKTSLLRTLCGQSFVDGGWKQVDDYAPERTFVLSAEAGLLCVRDLVTQGFIKGYEIGSLGDFQEAQRMCMNPRFKELGYRWIFIDSLTEISARCAENMAIKYPRKDDSFKLWGEYNQIMTSIIKSFRDLTDYNVVFTCLETTDKDNEGIRILAPDIAGSSLKSRLTSYFDEVFHMEKRTDANGHSMVLFATESPTGMSKDRSGKLAAFEVANLLAIQKKVLQ